MHGLLSVRARQVHVDGVFLTEGTYPKGSMWAMIPMPPTWLGPRCLPGPNDTDSTPNACQPWESSLVDGPCVPCPGTLACTHERTHTRARKLAHRGGRAGPCAGTPGSDCSRCDNGPAPAFKPPCDGCMGNDHFHAVRDVVRVPSHLPPGKYVLSWRYDCEATAQVAPDIG